MLLSNHTAGYKSWTCLDLSNHLLEIVNKWDDYKHDFDPIYTGYLPTHQIPIIKEIFKKFKNKNNLVYVDPCFADYGKMYQGFDKDHISTIKQLLQFADVILPNISEACFLTNTPYKDNFTLDEILIILEKLSLFNIQKIVITGLKLKNNELTSLVFNTKTKKYILENTPYYDELFHGTGDLFASSYIGLSMNGIDDEKALKITQKFLDLSIKDTIKNKEVSLCYGVNFEKYLYILGDALKN